MLPSIIRYLLSPPYRKHRKHSIVHVTARRSQPAPTRTTSSKASTRRSKRDNAGKQTELARASMSSIYTACSVLKTNEEIEICSVYKNIWWWCDARRVCLHTALSLRPFYFVHTCGVRVVFGNHRALGIWKLLQFAPNTVDLLCVSVICICSTRRERA